MLRAPASDKSSATQVGGEREARESSMKTKKDCAAAIVIFWEVL